MLSNATLTNDEVCIFELDICPSIKKIYIYIYNRAVCEIILFFFAKYVNFFLFWQKKKNTRCAKAKNCRLILTAAISSYICTNLVTEHSNCTSFRPWICHLYRWQHTYLNQQTELCSTYINAVSPSPWHNLNLTFFLSHIESLWEHLKWFRNVSKWQPAGLLWFLPFS